MKKGLEIISKKTTELWYAVNKKCGSHVYTLGVNGFGEVILSKGYTQVIAKGNRQTQKTLKALLND